MLHPSKAAYIFFSQLQGTFTKTGYILNYITKNLQEFKSHKLCSHSGIKLEIANRMISVKPLCIWKLNNRVLNNSRIKEEGFPGRAVVKNPPANAGDTGSSPGPGRSHMLQSN